MKVSLFSIIKPLTLTRRFNNIFNNNFLNITSFIKVKILWSEIVIELTLTLERE